MTSMPETNVEKFDPWEENFVANPFPALSEMRRNRPVFHDPNTGYWVISRYKDVRDCLFDAERLSASISLKPIRPLWQSTLDRLTAAGYVAGGALVNEDEPVHALRRRTLAMGFTPQKIKAKESFIRGVVTRYLDRIAGLGEADLVHDFCYQIPAIVLFDFVGIPEEDVDAVKEWSHCTTNYIFGNPTEAQQNETADRLANFWEYSKRHLARLRLNPGDDIISQAIAAQRDDPVLWDDVYLTRWVMMIIFAGHETTTNAMANAIQTLLQHRAAWEELVANPGKIPNAVEECLRFAGSVIAWRRQAKAPINVGGIDIPANAELLLYVGSANRDESTFVGGESFNIDRTNANRQLTFGYGAHNCMGAPLARLELRIMLEELTRRLPHARLVPNQRFEFAPFNTTNRGVNAVWARWDSAANPFDP